MPVPAPAAPSKPPEVVQAEDLASRMNGLSDRAEDPDLSDDAVRPLLAEMDRAFAEYAALPDAARSEALLQGALTRMTDLALQFDLDLNEAPESAPPQAASPKDELLATGTTFVSPEDIERTYQEVQKSLEAVNLGFEFTTNDAVLAYVHSYQTKLRDWFARSLARGAPQIGRMRQIFRDEGIPPSLVYLAIVESGFNANAVSRARAVGMWQFIAGTAKRYGLAVDFWEDQRRDPEIAARASARYLKDLYGIFGDWPLALAAYNAGEGKIQRALARHPDATLWNIRKTRLLRRETREYVPAILAAILVASNPEAYGFDPVPQDPPPPVATVTISQPSDLRVLARCAQVPLETLQALNPSLRRLMTPPRPFELRIPASSFGAFETELAKVPPEERVTVTMHTVRPGESLYSIARKYKVNSEAIRLANLLPSRRVRPNDTLVIPMGDAAADPSLYAEERRTPSLKGARVYRVKKGDTLSEIARRSGVPVYRLKELNGLDSDALSIGQRLVLGSDRGGVSPSAKGSQAAGGKTRVHHVQQGDTLWDLARHYGTTVDKICRANRISPGRRLHLGDTLVIP